LNNTNRKNKLIKSYFSIKILFKNFNREKLRDVC
jgi:hypothetical protein